MSDNSSEGGHDLGVHGPISEGFVAWLVGIGALVLAAVWIGGPEDPPRQREVPAQPRSAQRSLRSKGSANQVMVAPLSTAAAGTTAAGSGHSRSATTNDATSRQCGCPSAASFRCRQRRQDRHRRPGLDEVVKG